ncbi:MAG: thiamine phosphate synthase [Betaproteobacteria bacterium]|nr:thiamine phosphate synthase [Betaproteobacteria bacterium]
MPRRIEGLYGLTPDGLPLEALARLVAQALAGGLRCLQYRDKTAAGPEAHARAAALAPLCRRYGATFIVNDDVSLAQAVDADGVHLGEHDCALAQARRALGPGKLIGISCYDSLERALEAQAGGADYVAFGAAFPSPTKPGARRVDLAVIAQARARLRLPIVAIGGIRPDNAPALLAAGVDAIAVASSLFAAPDVGAQVAAFNRLWRQPSAKSCLVGG